MTFYLNSILVICKIYNYLLCVIEEKTRPVSSDVLFSFCSSAITYWHLKYLIQWLIAKAFVGKHLVCFHSIISCWMHFNMPQKCFSEMQLTIVILLFVTVCYHFHSIAVGYYFWDHSHVNVYKNGGEKLTDLT